MCSLLHSSVPSDSTLTTHNVVEVMKPVSYFVTQDVMRTSSDRSGKIERQYQSEEQRKEALIAHALSTHPCLSWNMIAAELQNLRYSEAAAEVTRKYVKGHYSMHEQSLLCAFRGVKSIQMCTLELASMLIHIYKCINQNYESK